jgi:hypothetical protein
MLITVVRAVVAAAAFMPTGEGKAGANTVLDVVVRFQGVLERCEGAGCSPMRTVRAAGQSVESSR